MRITTRLKSVFVAVGTAVAVVFGLVFASTVSNTFAANTSGRPVSDMHYVTIYNQNEKISVRTDATTVQEVLDRANIMVNQFDSIDPSPDTIINSDNFQINIRHARPVVIIDGKTHKYTMTSSYDMKTIASDAGLTLYDGDEIEMVAEADTFLEAGATNTYKITRNGGRTITIEESIPFGEETVKDYEMPVGETRVAQVGEEGRKVLKYKVNFVDGVETSRELVSEEVVKQPTNRIIAEGAKPSISPQQGTCADWVRAAGVAEADVPYALQLIYHESGCRVDAQNPSGAYGIPQALPGSKMAAFGDDWRTNPITQIKWMASYVRKYGGWQGAMQFWWEHGWY